MLQSKLAEGEGPALYLCPNNFLVAQTCKQAREFGVAHQAVESDGELPESFLTGDTILVTTVHKLFNGKSKFGLGSRSITVGSIVMDDAHACIDHIRDQFLIDIRRDVGEQASAYSELLSLFERELKTQGVGTFHDISSNDRTAYLPVPYWVWSDRIDDVAAILSRHRNTKALTFTWPILKDRLKHCQCLVTGGSVTVYPYRAPVEQFGSYAGARHRILISATITDDSFLVKGLGLSADVVRNPLVDPKEKWWGEKMVLIPSRINETLSRGAVVEHFAKPNRNRRHGTVALVPSSKRCGDWAKYGANQADRRTIVGQVKSLTEGKYEKTLVVANYYDGIDLPDNACRVLVIDSKPFSDDFQERYIVDRRNGSQLVHGRTARIIEQGMGRAVRGEKDYCVVFFIGPDVVRALRSPAQRRFFSLQTRTQIEIGHEISEMAREEIEDGAEPMDVLLETAKQCLSRDEGWKDFYTERMDSMELEGEQYNSALLNGLEKELLAERHFEAGAPDRAAKTIQDMLDKKMVEEASERGWYLQVMARYTYGLSKVDANRLQIGAHKVNRSLLRPKEGMEVMKVETLTRQGRMGRLKKWVTEHESYEDLLLDVDSILGSLKFGVSSDTFEFALDRLAQALGFHSDRPDHDWKEGPDNLWGLLDGKYLLIECKNMVDVRRAEISKDEADQMNRSSAWFTRHYPGLEVVRMMIHPTHKVKSSGGFRDPVSVIRKRELGSLAGAVRSFFVELRGVDFEDISEDSLSKNAAAHKLRVEDICELYSRKAFQLPQP